jgi:hypothetical protein
MKTLWAKTALILCVTALTGPAALGDDGPASNASEKTPELEIATAVAKKVDGEEAVWRDLTVKLRKAVEAYNPASVHLMPEGQSLEAFRDYCAKLHESGKHLLALYEKWDKASEGLADSLRKAPAYYRSASKAMRQKAETGRFAVINERYLLTADIWEQLAVKAEQRCKNLNLDKNSKAIVDLIREENSFLADFLSTLDAVPRVSGDASGQYKELLVTLRRHAQQSDELHRQLKNFRDKLTASPSR